MRKLKDSDIFTVFINRDNSILGRINSILQNAEPSTVILNKYIYQDIKRYIVDKYKEESVNKMANMISSGQIVIFRVDPPSNISSAIPFFVYKRNGVTHAAVNLTGVVKEIKLNDGSIQYELVENAKKAYNILMSAYLAVSKFTEKTTILPDLAYHSAIVWAEMFNTPLFDIVGLHNTDRRDAFMYFAIKFFLKYYVDYPEQMIENSALKFIGKKNQLIFDMEEAIERKDLDIYKDMSSFIRMLCDNEITGVKGINMNLQMYITKFASAYSSTALGALCTFPYFVFVIIAASSKTKLVKDKAFDRVFKATHKSLAKMLMLLTKE